MIIQAMHIQVMYTLTTIAYNLVLLICLSNDLANF